MKYFQKKWEGEKERGRELPLEFSELISREEFPKFLVKKLLKRIYINNWNTGVAEGEGGWQEKKKKEERKKKKH